MDNETRKFICETIKSELDQQRQEGHPKFLSKDWFQRNYFKIINVLVPSFLALVAIFISYKGYKISYEKTYPTANIQIEYDIEKNSKEFESFIEKYVNNVDYTDLAFKVYMTVKNKNINIKPRLYSIGAELQIDIWMLKEAESAENRDLELLSNFFHPLAKIPIIFVDDQGQKQCPLVPDLLVGYVRFQQKKDDFYSTLSRFL